MQFFKRLAHKNETIEPGAIHKMYSDFVNEKIRMKYTLPDELAILRQRDTKPDEFEAYNVYVEACKTEARIELGMN